MDVLQAGHDRFAVRLEEGEVVGAGQVLQAEVAGHHVGDGFGFDFPGLAAGLVSVFVEELVSDFVDEGFRAGGGIEDDCRHRR